MQKLALRECACLLQAANVEAQPSIQDIQGVPFLSFDVEELSSQAWRLLSAHSTVCFAATQNDEWLHPVGLVHPPYLPQELAQLPKYKGKTNVEFTMLLLNCARAASAYAFAQEPLTVMDPLCGRGTTLWCALVNGDCAIGADADDKAIAECDAYVTRYLEYHRLKHQKQRRSLTLPGGGSARETYAELAPDAEGYKRGDRRTLRLIAGEIDRVQRALPEQTAHLIVTDMPYGVQHAPKEGKRVSTLEQLAREVATSAARLLKPGGAIAVSFNEYTLCKSALQDAMSRAGLNVLKRYPYDDFSHWVEQAVQRDVVIAKA